MIQEALPAAGIVYTGTKMERVDQEYLKITQQ